MDELPDHTSTPLVLVANTGVAAVGTFGPSYEDCTLATYDEILAGGYDDLLRRTRFVGIGEGEGQVAALRYLLSVRSASREDVVIAAEIGVEAGPLRDDITGVVAEHPEFVVAGTELIGRAVCLRVESSSAARSREIDSPTIDPRLFMPADSDRTVIEEFVHGAAAAHLREELEKVKRQHGMSAARLKRARGQLRQSRRQSKALRRRVRALRESRWARFALAAEELNKDLASKLRIAPRVLAVLLLAVVALLVTVAPISLLVSDGWEWSHDGAILAGFVFLPVLFLLILSVQRQMLSHDIDGISGSLQRVQTTTRQADRRQVAALRRVERSAVHTQQQLGQLAEVREQLEVLRTERSEWRSDLEGRLGALSESLETISSQLGRAQEEIPPWFRQFERRHNRTHMVGRQQTEATLNLHSLSPPSAAVPHMGGWAASPDVLLLLVDELLSLRPRTVVECGSGVSTLWLAKMIDQHSMPTRLVSLEHDPRFRDKTLEVLRRHGLERVAEVRHAPLTDRGEQESPWYDPNSLSDVNEVGLLFVDGPPADTGDKARMPAVPELLECLAPDCTIVLDDLVRHEEKEIAKVWRTLLPDFEYEEVSLEKGAAVFRRRSSGGSL
jgi:predicted O-methyltransferase YrrM